MHECVVFSRGGDCGGGRGQKLVQFLVRFNRSGWFEVVFYVAVGSEGVVVREGAEKLGSSVCATCGNAT